MSAEAPIFATTYGVFLQPFMLISILVGVYGLTVVTKSMQEIAPGMYRHLRIYVIELMRYPLYIINYYTYAEQLIMNKVSKMNSHIIC